MCTGDAGTDSGVEIEAGEEGSENVLSTVAGVEGSRAVCVGVSAVFDISSLTGELCA